MRAEKQIITAEYLERLKASPFFITVDYTGLKVEHFSELRNRLAKTGAEIHVIKNTIFKVAAKEAGIADLAGSMVGQLAIVTGQQDVASSAKVLKTFESEFDRPKLKFGYLGDERLESDQLKQIADLPPLDVLRSQILAVINAPAQKLATMINTPATQLAQVIRARVEKEQAAAK